jgi:magnesium-transporting ATPase (P-type)
MNKTVVTLFFFLILISILLAASSYTWNTKYGDSTTYLYLKDTEDDNQEKNKSYQVAIKSFFSYFALCSNFIPVSLLVTVEVAKLV